jgi:hypothetical protein
MLPVVHDDQDAEEATEYRHAPIVDPQAGVSAAQRLVSAMARVTQSQLGTRRPWKKHKPFNLQELPATIAANRR